MTRELDILKYQAIPKYTIRQYELWKIIIIERKE